MDIVPPMAGMVVPETAIINHGGEPLDLQNLRGVRAGVSNGGVSKGRKHTGCLGAREQCGIASLLAVALSPSLVKLGEDPNSFHQTLK